MNKFFHSINVSMKKLIFILYLHYNIVFVGTVWGFGCSIGITLSHKRNIHTYIPPLTLSPSFN